MIFADGHARSMKPSQATWGLFYGVTQKGETPFSQPCWTQGFTSNCYDGNGDYSGPDYWWGGNTPPWYAHMAPPSMDEQEVAGP